MNSDEIRPTATVEDYLELIHRLERDGKKAIAARLAEVLHVSMPTVTLTLKRMARDGWVDLDGQKHIHLTSRGEQAAHSVIRRHMLAEWMLVRMLNVPWSDAHNEAHQIEHTISERVEDRLNNSLDHPSSCPHGNPLPDFEEYAGKWITLTSVTARKKVIIRRIHENMEGNQEALQFLESNGILPGIILWVDEVLSFNQTVTLDLDGRKISLGWAIAGSVYVDCCRE